MLTITTISTGITALIFLSLGLTLYRSWRKEKGGEDLQFFYIFLFAFGIQQMLFSFGTGIGSENPIVSNWFWAIAHFFMFVGISYLLRFSMKMKFFNAEKKIFKIALGYSIIGEAIIIYSIPTVQPFLLDNGIYNWKVPALPGAVIGIFTTICLLFSFWIFVSGIKRLPTSILKFRSLMLAFGILLFFIGGPMHNFITTPLLNFIADATLVSGVAMMAFGIYIPRIFKTSQQQIKH